MPVIKIRRGTTTQWNSSTKILESGELGLDLTLNKLKSGNGTSLWTSLPYINILPSELSELAQDAVESAISAGTGITKNYNDTANTITLAVDSTIANKTYVDTAVSGLGSTAAESYVPLSIVGSADGVASLDPDGKVPDSEIPAGITRDTELSSAISTEVTDRNTAITAAISNLIDTAPDALNTLNEIAAAINDDASYAATITTALGNKAPLASPTFTGTVTIPAGSAITGVPYLATANTFTNSPQTINIASTTAVGLIVKGLTSQTANLQEWQNGDGTVVARIHADGSATLGVLTSVSDYRGAYGIGGGGLTTGVGAFAMKSWLPTVVTGVLRGATSQTANLQEWQNSAGTVLAKVSSDGTITAGNITSTAYAFLTGTTYAYNIASAADYGTTMMQFNSSKNLAITANATITSQAAGTVALTLVAAASQTANLMETAGGFRISSGGNQLHSPAIYANYNFLATAGLAGVVPIIAKGAASQTADLQQWQNSAGTVLAAVTSSGRIWATAMTVATSGAVTAGSQFGVVISSVSTVGIGVKGAASQTADLQQWQDSAGTMLANVSSSGQFLTPRLTITNGGNIVDSAGTTPYLGFGSNQIRINTRNAAYKGLVIQGEVSQTANLQEWQDSSGTVLARITSTGTISGTNGLSATGGSITGINSQANSIGSAISGVNWAVTAGGPTLIPIVAKGATSQTANLQEWQDSAGAVLAKITASGAIDVTGITVNGGAVALVASPTFTGTPLAPTASAGTNTTQIATTAFVKTAVDGVIASAPGALDTLDELAAALNDDSNFATTVTNSIATKAPIASPTFTGTVAGVTSTHVGLGNVDNTSDANKPVSTATQTALDLKLNLSDPSVDYYITNSGSGAYLVNGVSNGLITFEKGKKYRIHVNATGHPFWIQTVSGAYSSGNVYSTGITNGGAQAGHILVELPQDAPDSLYYACQFHSSMAGSISVQSDNTVTINSKSSSYTILPIDSNRLIEMSAGGTLTITDSASFPVGFTCDILQTGASQVTIDGTSFTPSATPGLKLRTQWSSATLIKRALNSWVVLGDLSA